MQNGQSNTFRDDRDTDKEQCENRLTANAFGYRIEESQGVLEIVRAIVPGTYIPGVPCVTLRDNTERPETVEVGANILAGADHPNRILERTELMLTKEGGGEDWEGDGDGMDRNE
ncbi:MAG: UDP-N-acetyl glucosamine 2-epimerase [Euryarchaeota archaeon]|nr:UDP-N-acetyl glucosamine 2-epimerase [Euryarchaeota archaeon]